VICNLMQHMHNNYRFIINTLKMLNNKCYNNKIKAFKSDNTEEYKNKKINEFCKENDIEIVYSPLYNPENNGLI